MLLAEYIRDPLRQLANALVEDVQRHTAGTKVVIAVSTDGMESALKAAFSRTASRVAAGRHKRGSTSHTTQKAIEIFQRGLADILLCDAGTLKVGVNLQQASQMYVPTSNTKKDDVHQTLSRLCRMNTEHEEVNHTWLVCSSTLDEHLHSFHERVRTEEEERGGEIDSSRVQTLEEELVLTPSKTMGFQYGTSKTSSTWLMTGKWNDFELKKSCWRVEGNLVTLVWPNEDRPALLDKAACLVLRFYGTSGETLIRFPVGGPTHAQTVSVYAGHVTARTLQYRLDMDSGSDYAFLRDFVVSMEFPKELAFLNGIGLHYVAAVAECEIRTCRLTARPSIVKRDKYKVSLAGRRPLQFGRPENCQFYEACQVLEYSSGDELRLYINSCGKSQLKNNIDILTTMLSPATEDFLKAARAATAEDKTPLHHHNRFKCFSGNEMLKMMNDGTYTGWKATTLTLPDSVQNGDTVTFMAGGEEMEVFVDSLFCEDSKKKTRAYVRSSFDGELGADAVVSVQSGLSFD